MNRSFLRPALAAAALAVLAAAPAFADTRIEKNLKLDSGGKLTIVADAGSVTVTGTAASGAHVLLTSSRDDLESRFDLKFEELPGEVRITMKKKESLDFWSSWFNNSRISFEIQVPTKTRTDLSTGGGFLSLSSLEGDAKLSTSGGHIEVTKLTGNLVGETSGGHIALKSVTGDAKIETSGGHIEVDGVTGALRGETSGERTDGSRQIPPAAASRSASPRAIRPAASSKARAAGSKSSSIRTPTSTSMRQPPAAASAATSPSRSSARSPDRASRARSEAAASCSTSTPQAVR
jgi:hypothetical protein